MENLPSFHIRLFLLLGTSFVTILIPFGEKWRLNLLFHMWNYNSFVFCSFLPIPFLLFFLVPLSSKSKAKLSELQTLISSQIFPLLTAPLLDHSPLGSKSSKRTAQRKDKHIIICMKKKPLSIPHLRVITRLPGDIWCSSVSFLTSGLGQSCPLVIVTQHRRDLLFSL